MKQRERIKELIITILGFLIYSASFVIYQRGSLIREWILRFGCYAGILMFLLWGLRLSKAAQGVDPDSREALKEYLKLASVYAIVLFIAELPIILASL